MMNQVAQLRQGRDLTEEALGQALGVSRQTIISIEKGTFDPSLSLAFRLSEFFDRRIEQMLFRDER